MHDLPHDTTTLTLAGLLTLVAGWKGWDIVKWLMSGGGKLLDTTAARQKIVVQAQLDREKLASEREVSDETLIAKEREELRKASLALMDEQRKNHQEFREEVREQIKALKEDVQQATIFANVAQTAAADKEAEARQLRAEKSVCDYEIASLLSQLLAFEQDKKKQEEIHEGEKQKLKDRIAELEARSASLEQRISHMTAIVLQKHPDTKGYPESLVSEQAIEDFLRQVSSADNPKP